MINRKINKNKKNITILGTGSFGTSIANVLSDNNHNIIMYGIDDVQINDINKYHINSKFFGNDLKINKKIKATKNFLEAIKFSEYIIFCVPTISVKKLILMINKYLDHPVNIINTSKGFDEENNNVLSNLFFKYLNNNKILKSFSVLYGPSLAKEVILKKPTCVMVVSEKISYAKKIKKIFDNDYFITFVDNDLIGSEYLSALKNLIAIASGIIYGLYNSDNAKAALITIGFNEIKKIALKKGAKIKTFLNFSGLGDLLLTTNSTNSRNFNLGLQIGKINNVSSILNFNKSTVEGVLTSKIIFNILKKENINSLFFETIYNILYKNYKPSSLIDIILKK